MMTTYYDNFGMRFTTGKFTIDCQRLEVGIPAGCTLSVVLFILVMEMVLKSTETKGAEVKTPLKAFMDDITILSKSEPATRDML